MSKSFEEMTDSEFFVECSKLLSKMCDRMKSAHEQIAQIASETGNDAFVRPMLEHSMYTCIEGVGNILNGIDLVDESAEESVPIFEELRRRLPGVMAQ